ncbi:MAG: flippase-like domain-containing protein, partial [Myxococcales bacterium]|nr:flippase-like domain-containing protein [Myxococcales bacterium]
MTALKVGASAGLVWWALRDVDLGEAWRLLRGVSALALLGMAAAFVAKVATSVVRWRVVLGHLDADLPLGRSVAIVLLGVFFNQCLPSSIGGDGVRVFQARRAGMSL